MELKIKIGRSHTRKKTAVVSGPVQGETDLAGAVPGVIQG